MRKKRLTPWIPPEAPDEIKADPEKLSKWNEYWDAAMRDWEYEREEEYRKNKKESRNS